MRKPRPRSCRPKLTPVGVQCGGGAPADWCRRLRGRLPMLHMKDYRFDNAAGRPVMAEIGACGLEWKKIIAAAEESGCQ